MKKYNLFILIVIFLFISSCEREKNEPTKNYEIKGFAQKGPFKSGTNITVIELKNTLQPTGLNFYSTVYDNMGSFIVPDVELSSNYVELMADGFYFDENWGRTTIEKLLLKAIADVSVKPEININVLTHISAERVKYLVQNEARTFNEAKTQAQNEILKIFNMDGDDTDNYEMLDLSKEGELNSKLLAISSIIQGNRNIADLTELITDIGSDIKTDGVIDSEDLQTKLATAAVLCNIGGIRTNLADYYSNDSVFNNFQNHVKHFIENTEFESMIDLNFPEVTLEGENLLALPDNYTLDTTSVYCLSQSLNITNLDRFRIAFTIIKTSGTGNVIYSTIDLSGWEYESNYCSVEPTIGLGCGIGLYLMYSWPISSASETPLSIRFQDSGEMMLTIYIDSESLPDNGGSYIIKKYMTW
jgi:hypothetical protein